MDIYPDIKRCPEMYRRYKIIEMSMNINTSILILVFLFIFNSGKLNIFFFFNLTEADTLSTKVLQKNWVGKKLR